YLCGVEPDLIEGIRVSRKSRVQSWDGRSWIGQGSGRTMLRRPSPAALGLEGLEDRQLLSGNPITDVQTRNQAIAHWFATSALANFASSRTVSTAKIFPGYVPKPAGFVSKQGAGFQVPADTRIVEAEPALLTNFQGTRNNRPATAQPVNLGFAEGQSAA